MSATPESFESAFAKAVDLGNKLADKDKDADLWDIADGLLAGARAEFDKAGVGHDLLVVPGIFETSLALVSHVLLFLRVPPGGAALTNCGRDTRCK